MRVTQTHFRQTEMQTLLSPNQVCSLENAEPHSDPRPSSWLAPPESAHRAAGRTHTGIIFN